MTVVFRTIRDNFPSDMEGLKIQSVLLYFIRADGQLFEVSLTHLRFTGGEAEAIGGAKFY